MAILNSELVGNWKDMSDQITFTSYTTGASLQKRCKLFVNENLKLVFLSVFAGTGNMPKGQITLMTIPTKYTPLLDTDTIWFIGFYSNGYNGTGCSFSRLLINNDTGNVQYFNTSYAQDSIYGQVMYPIA